MISKGMDALDSEILIREMREDEEKAVKEFYKKNLGIIDTIIFNLSFSDILKSSHRGKGTTFIATKEDRIVGSFSVKVQEYREKQVGFIDAIVTDKNLRGQGLGASLFDVCLKWLQNKRCDIIVATADRYNSPSWNLFMRNGFWVYETKDQIKEFNLTFLRLWLAEFYFIAIGVFFLRRGREKNKSKETGQSLNLLTAWIGLALILSILGLRSGAESILYPFLAIIAAVSILVHESAHSLVSRHYGLETVFKAWDSGLLFSLFLSAFGIVLPAYGSTYLKQRDWRYEAGSQRMGIIYAVGPMASLILGTFFLTLSMNTSNLLIKRVMGAGSTINYVSVLFNLLPFQAVGGFPWDGRKIFTWSKTVWILLVVGLALLALTDIFIA